MKPLPYLIVAIMVTLLVTACGGAATPTNPDVATPETGQNGGSTKVDPTIAQEVATQVSTASPELSGDATIVAVETPNGVTPEAEGTPAPNETVVATMPSTDTMPTIESTVPVTEGMEIPEGALMVITRNGGIAGFCDTVTIYNDDRVTWESCNATQGGDATLDATLHDELMQLVEMYGNIAFENTDAPGAADAMTIGVHIAGTGSASLDENGQRNLLIFANDVFNTLYSVTNS